MKLTKNEIRSLMLKTASIKNGETINLNKEVVIEYNRDYGFNNENNSFKIKKIKRYDENIRIYLDFNKNNKVKQQPDGCCF